MKKDPKLRIGFTGNHRILRQLYELLHEAGYEIPVILPPPIQRGESSPSLLWGNLAARLGTTCDVLVHHNIHSEKILTAIKDYDLDLIINYGHSQRFSETLLALPRLGILNLHPGNLPRYRGREVVQGAMANGERHIIQTIHVMGHRYDDGRILATRKVAIGKKDDRAAMEEKLHQNAAAFYAKTIIAYLSGKIKGHIMKGQDAYFPADPKGAAYIDWQQKSLIILRRFKGRHPLLPSMIYLSEAGIGYNVGEMTAAKTRKHIGWPGQILDIDNGRLLVKTLDAALWLGDVRPQNNAENAKTFSLKIGMRFAVGQLSEVIALQDKIAMLTEKLQKMGGGT
jgi:methionyl-tRNA formyltransferase